MGSRPPHVADHEPGERIGLARTLRSPRRCHTSGRQLVGEREEPWRAGVEPELGEREEPCRAHLSPSVLSSIASHK